MIRIYCVLLVGEPFFLESEKEEFGFYRNEYVIASSEENAISIAKRNTIKKLRRKNINAIEGHPMTLKADEVKSGMPIWRLFRNEGFIFFPVNS